MARIDGLGALRERQFRLLWLGQTTSTLGDGLVPVGLAFAVIGTLDRSATALGVVLAAHMIPLVTFVLVGGVWADRLPRQLVMLASDVVRGLVQAALAVLLLTGSAELWQLVALMAVYGTADAFFQPAATGLVPATVSAPRLQQANALLGLSRSTAFVVGPALAGVIVAATNPGILFAVDAVTFAVSATSLALLRVARTVREGERKSFFADLGGGWHEVVSHTWLWVIVAWASTFLFFVFAPFLTLGPLVAKQSLGGPAAWGMIAAAFGAGSLAGGVLALRWKPVRPMLACAVLSLLVTPAIALLALRAPAPAIATAEVFGGVSMGFFGAVWQTTLQQHVPEESLSRVSAWDWLGSFIFMPLGFILVGPISDVIGVSTTLWISAAWAAASTLIVIAVPSVRTLRRLEPEPAPAPEAALSTLPQPAEVLHG